MRGDTSALLLFLVSELDSELLLQYHSIEATLFYPAFAQLHEYFYQFIGEPGMEPLFLRCQSRKQT